MTLTTENVLHIINQNFVTLKTSEVAHNNQLLKSALDLIISLMRDADPLFNSLYKGIYYGGSYFDDLKVGKPDEYDLDLLLELPKICQTHKSKICECVKVVPSNKPGFFWFEIQTTYFESFNKFIKDGYVQTDLVLNWLQSLVTKALNKIPFLDYSYTTPSYNSQSGPALTLRLYGNFGEVDVDLVPAFKLSAAQWPEMRYRANPSTKKTEFFIVPKKARGINKAERYWRASFQDQEKELINQKQRLKPALRLLKKLRTNLGHCSISSYALKTIVLWELNSFDWNESLSFVFLKLLEKYKECLKNKRIPYYWNSRGNLLEGIHTDTLTNHCNEITRKINKFYANYETNPTEIAKIILKEGSEEYNLFLDLIDNPGNVYTQQVSRFLSCLTWYFSRFVF